MDTRLRAMATTKKRGTGKPSHTRSPLSRLSIAQLTKLRALARTHPDLTYAITGNGLLIAAYLPSWLAEGWLRMGDRIDGTDDATPITHLLPADGKLRGYCEQKPTDAEQGYCGTRSQRTGTKAKRLTFKPYDADALTAALTSARAKARKAARKAA